VRGDIFMHVFCVDLVLSINGSTVLRVGLYNDCL